VIYSKPGSGKNLGYAEIYPRVLTESREDEILLIFQPRSEES
jgi:hypothetical protein